MNTPQNTNRRHSSITYLALRQWLGILGLALPILLVIFNRGVLKPSISHYYYSSASVLFIGFMFSFGLFLIFYPGRKDNTDKISDNWITTIGGLGAILTAIIPTAYCSKYKEAIEIKTELSHFCGCEGLTTQYIHNNPTIGFIHLCCAAIFLILMGYMSYARFTKGNTTKKMKIFYKTCAIMVWAPLLILGIILALKLKSNENLVFICECVSLIFFGAAWLVKGKKFKRFGFY